MEMVAYSASGSATTSLAPGFRFHPTDEELVVYYLRRKICGKSFTFDAISEIDIYRIEPWDLPVMHEYKLTDEKLVKAGFSKNAVVLCRIFQKSGPGPKNGENYGAPLIVEEWEDEDFELPKMGNAEEVEVVDNDSLNRYDLEQIFGTDVPPVSAPLPMVSCPGDNETFVENSTGLTNGIQNFVVNEQPHSLTYEEPQQYSVEAKPIQQENLLELSTAPGENDFLIDESFWDAIEDLQFGDVPFIETNDLEGPIGANDVSFDDMLDDFLSFQDANNVSFGNPDNFHNAMVENISQKAVTAENQQGSSLSKHRVHQNNDTVASSVEKEPEKLASDCQYAFLQKASKMLGSIPAPHAFAAEFPAKHEALRLNTLSQSSTPVHVTSGVIQVKSYGTDWAACKNTPCYNIIFSVGLSRGDMNSGHLETSRKSAAAMSRGWINVALLSVLALSVGFKLGTLMCGW